MMDRLNESAVQLYGRVALKARIMVKRIANLDAGGNQLLPTDEVLSVLATCLTTFFDGVIPNINFSKLDRSRVLRACHEIDAVSIVWTHKSSDSYAQTRIFLKNAVGLGLTGSLLIHATPKQ